MRPVQREEILDHVTYSERREEIRRGVMVEKALRRVRLGDCVTLLFENHETVRYQVQEMVRAERIVREADIEREISTYNELLGDEGEFGSTLLVEIDDAAERAVKLSAWTALPERVYLGMDDAERVFATIDERQRRVRGQA